MDVSGAKSAIEVASQTGRLDLLTATLAVLAILIGFSAFPLFFYVRHRAQAVAREAVEEVLRTAVERVERTATLKLEEMLPTLVEEYLELARNAVSADLGDQIAAAQEDDKK